MNMLRCLVLMLTHAFCDVRFEMAEPAKHLQYSK